MDQEQNPVGWINSGSISSIGGRYKIMIVRNNSIWYAWLSISLFRAFVRWNIQPILGRL